ncbi:hypothetical protein QBC33DRAFT_602032 [Phialemonium atrogriseum]|uniref:BTB domain-containing protein n=1 Tax=Phialemonium atrogriseum TaxID=1093897 RepID=A0AAJ0FHI4_9PEZI|nr:uncharacterized protein QBC33DRAFT_602032 [Phialemonium atrogriseum]KAK1762209.1 hypothetical protein QBC33DRAFT_602032 [Phialemonium atrogriseum]
MESKLCRKLVKGLLSTRDYSGCTIVCGSDQHLVHKAIICPQSPFFKAAFAHDMKENATGTVNLEEDDPEVVKTMVYYFYHNDYQAPPRNSGCESNNNSIGTVQPPGPNLLHHSRVYALAEKYGIPSLKVLAVKKFTDETNHWRKHEDFAKAAREIYTATPDHDRGMRDAVVDTIRVYRDLLDDDDIESVLRDTRLAYDLVIDLRDDPEY